MFKNLKLHSKKGEKPSGCIGQGYFLLKIASKLKISSFCSYKGLLRQLYRSIIKSGKAAPNLINGRYFNCLIG